MPQQRAERRGQSENRKHRNQEAQMAESVDALVSNTNDSNVVPVRPRLWVPKRQR